MMSINKVELTSTEQSLEMECLSNDLKPLQGLVDVILFGSGAKSQLTNQSDLDVLLVFDTTDSLKIARTKYYRAKSTGKLPRDLIWMDLSTYNENKDLGGICFIANLEGSSILEQGNYERG